MSANKADGNQPKEPTIKFCGLLFSILCPTIIGWVIIWYLEERSYFPGVIVPRWYPTSEITYPIFSGSYALIGAASYLIWKVGSGVYGLVLPQLFNAVQLLASYAWFILLYKQDSFVLGLVASTVQWVASLVTLILFGKVQKESLLLTSPYLIWHGVVFALSIQLYIQYRLS